MRMTGCSRLTSIATVRVQGMYLNVIGLDLILESLSNGLWLPRHIKCLDRLKMFDKQWWCHNFFPMGSESTKSSYEKI